MSQHVLITGTGRPYALGFNLVKRYLEHGDSVFASVRRPSEALEELKRDYPDRLHILTMDIASTESVNAAAREAERLTDRLDLIVNNATTASADTMKELPDFGKRGCGGPGPGAESVPAVVEKKRRRRAGGQHFLRGRKHREMLPHLLFGLRHRKGRAEYADEDPA